MFSRQRAAFGPTCQNSGVEYTSNTEPDLLGYLKYNALLSYSCQCKKRLFLESLEGKENS